MSVLSEIAAGAGGAIVVLLVQAGWSISRDMRDGRRIYSWMVSEEAAAGSNQFRSTRVIASHTNLTEERVVKLCSEHAKIFLSTGSKEGMWSVSSRTSKGTYG
jgi:hypothetical protein